jgi:DNA-binding HxlR family transcriptional regulator
VAEEKIVQTESAETPSLLISPKRIPADSAARATDLVGDFWTQLILHSAFVGVHRFEDLLSRTRIARSLLAQRLTRLVSAGILTRQIYQDRPVRYEYRLTPMGLGLHASTMMMVRWERRWHFDPSAAAQRPVHTTCGKEFTPEMVCGGCAAPIDARDTYAVPGPGAGWDPLPETGQRRSIYSVKTADSIQPSVYRVVELMSDRWTSHVVAAAFWKARRFKDFQERLGIATNILADRLNRMVEHGVFTRRAYQTRPERFEYRLTEQGRDIFPLTLALQQWGDRWLDQGKGPPVIIRHRPCGSRLVPQIVCNQCGGEVNHRNVTLPPGTEDVTVYIK